MRFTNSLLLPAFLFPAVFSSAQEWELTGALYSAADSAPVPFASVINVSVPDAVNSDAKGKFSIAVHPADSILISALGYEKKSFRIPSGIKMLRMAAIYLIPAPYQIDTVVVRAMPPKELFPWAFKNLELPDENKINLNLPENGTSLPFLADANEMSVHAPNELLPLGGITIPIIRNTPAKKLQKEKEELSRQKHLLEEIDRKYSNEFISRLTGIKKEKKIVELKKFCNLPADFILQKTEYEIAMAVMDCLGDLKRNRCTPVLSLKQRGVLTDSD
ncbi:MAG TPA: hypothetical protein VNJ07_14100 [Chitinophagales bacterium]|nr:hypothetical protein [Chitinophagales bacterium]